MTVLAVSTVALVVPAQTAVARVTFDDTGGSVFAADIEAVFAAGITTGCNPPDNTNYCPNDPVTRGQMAAFLNRALKLPASTTTNTFTDHSNIFLADIEAIFAAGITTGCNPPDNTNYCPNDPVTRGQMAAFLNRALKLPASTTTNTFTDHSNIFLADIEAIFAAGITTGCNPPDNTNYCPNDPVTRGQMAAFLNRALKLPEPPVVFAAGGDIGASPTTALVLEGIKNSDAEFFLALGDLSYNQVVPEQAWCDWMEEQLGPDIPIQVIVGNHEEDSNVHGFIGDYAKCAPDEMGSSGLYGVQYYFDVGSTVRVINLAAGTTVFGTFYNYEPGSEQADWLTQAIRDARSQGISWVVVASHKPCITVGVKSCQSGQALLDLLISEKVDLALYGHDHNYQRSHQLTCAQSQLFLAECLSDTDGSHQAGAGTVFVVNGAMGGRRLYTTDPDDIEAPYFAAHMGATTPDRGNGFVEIEVSRSSLTMRFVNVTTDWEDQFTLTK